MSKPAGNPVKKPHGPSWLKSARNKAMLEKRAISRREPLWIVGSFASLFFGLLTVSYTARLGFFGESGIFSSFPELLWPLSLIASWFVATIVFKFLRRSSAPWMQSLLFFFVLFLGFLFILNQSGVLTSPHLLRQIGIPENVGEETWLLWLIALLSAGLFFLAHHLLATFSRNFAEQKIRAVTLGLGMLSSLFLIASFALPEGVNSHFASEAWPLFFALALLASAVAPWESIHVVKLRLRKSPWVDFKFSDLLFTLVPLVPIPRYFALNLDYLTLSSGLVLIAVIFSSTVVLVNLVPMVLGIFGDRYLLMSFSSAGLFILFSMASFSNSRAWYGAGSLVEQLLFLSGAIVVLAVLSQAKKEVLAVAVVLFFLLELGSSVWQAGSGEGGRATDEALPQVAPAWAAEVASEPWKSSPNVYFLVYESYANEETLNSYGIDNSRQMSHLLELGFTIYDGTYSLGAASLESISRVLDVSPEVSGTGRHTTAGNSLVRDIFDSQGYSTHGIFSSDYFFLGEVPGYGTYFPETGGPADTVLKSIFRGEFRADESATVVDYESYLEEKRGILGTVDGGPAFLHTHNKYPGHSQNSGNCLPDEIGQYEDRLELGNLEMNADLASIPDLDDAIIILVGDHGPYLTKNCAGIRDYPISEIGRLDIQDRLGSFVAIRFPEGSADSFQIELLQDVFPAVFAYLVDDNALLEEARVTGQTETGRGSTGADVDAGVIVGGTNDGEDLFLIRGTRTLE